MKKRYNLDKCPVCGGKEFSYISVGSPSGYVWLTNKIKGCENCGCVVLETLSHPTEKGGEE